MRRVIDDSKYPVIARQLCDIIRTLNPSELREYSYGIDRVKVSYVRDAILARSYGIKLGKVEHAHGIGNNNAYEIIYTGNPIEEQICGYLHLTDDMYGGVICWVSDYDGSRTTESRKLR